MAERVDAEWVLRSIPCSSELQLHQHQSRGKEREFMKPHWQGSWPLSCPVCDADLLWVPGALRCPAGHAFDVAREGYVNLLPPQHRVQGISGDTADMLRARRRFLEASHFRPLADHLVTETARALEGWEGPPPGSDCACVLEIGCGEGHYIGRIARELNSPEERPTAFAGMDLSKAAARIAAKRHGEVLFFVGDVHRRIYLRTASVRVLLNIFSPRNPKEFARVLEPGGHIVMVIPSADHLASLRDSLGLLSIQAEKERRLLHAFADEFRLVNRLEISYPLELSPAAVEDLVRMGPNRWHGLPGQVELPRQRFVTRANFVLLRLQRR